MSLTAQTGASFPPRPAAKQALGVNGGFEAKQLAAAQALGATVVRASASWPAIEDYKTGTLSFGPGLEEALRKAGSMGIAPMLTAAYGPPYGGGGKFTLTADAPVGSRELAVAEDTSQVKLGFDFVQRGGEYICKLWGYYGSLISAIMPGHLFLACKTSVALKTGDVLNVARVRYAPLSREDRGLVAPSVSAYVRYARFVAEKLAALTPHGYVCIWNEPPWQHDPWVPGLVGFYDEHAPASSQGGGMHTLLAALWKSGPLPPGVKFVSGAPDKDGAFQSILKQYQVGIEGNKGENYIALPSGAELNPTFAGEGMHPYGQNPEALGWDEHFNLMNPDDKGANFNEMTQHLTVWGAKNGYHLTPMATECGAETADEDKHAIYTLRRVLSLWGGGVPLPVIFHLAGHGASMNLMVVEGETLKPRLSYIALQRLMGVMRDLGGGGSGEGGPAVQASSGLTYPLCSAPFYGVNGKALFLWQRSWGSHAVGNWSTLPPPAPGQVTVGVRAGNVMVTNLRTGDMVAPTVTAGSISVAVSDDPVAVVVT